LKYLSLVLIKSRRISFNTEYKLSQDPVLAVGFILNVTLVLKIKKKFKNKKMTPNRT